MTDKPSVLFVCVHNAGRSQMAQGWLRHLAGDTVEVRSAGSAPAEQINPVAVEAMREAGIDITAEAPKILTADTVRDSDVVITMGCGDTCPVFPGKRYEDWDVPDPAGQPLQVVRRIRDEVRDRVQALLSGLPKNNPARHGEAEAVLLVDVANVVGSRPDGWWRDRAGAASRLLASLAGLRGATVPHPDGARRHTIAEVVAVLEGAGRAATAPDGVVAVSAAHDGDSEIVAQAVRIAASGKLLLVVTADRGLRVRLPERCEIAGPEWLNRLIGR